MSRTPKCATEGCDNPAHQKDETSECWDCDGSQCYCRNPRHWNMCDECFKAEQNDEDEDEDEAEKAEEREKWCCCKCLEWFDKCEMEMAFDLCRDCFVIN